MTTAPTDRDTALRVPCTTPGAAAQLGALLAEEAAAGRLPAGVRPLPPRGRVARLVPVPAGVALVVGELAADAGLADDAELGHLGVGRRNRGVRA